MDVWDYERARRYLLAMQRPQHELANHRSWVDGNTPRFLRTLELTPPDRAGVRCLEIGGIPFTFTLLLKKLRPSFDTACVDYFAGARSGEKLVETVRLPDVGEEHTLETSLVDLEQEPLPLADESVDGTFCCEVLEHVTVDPVNMLVEAHRVLRPDGWFILTTPNVARLQNVLALLHGRNVYNPYELTFGPTWRHNREYTAREVADLLAATGFIVEQVIVEDSNPPFYEPPVSQKLIRRAFELVYRQNYGLQMYFRARRGPSRHRVYPSWLFTHEVVRPDDATPSRCSEDAAVRR